MCCTIDKTISSAGWAQQHHNQSDEHRSGTGRKKSSTHKNIIMRTRIYDGDM